MSPKAGATSRYGIHSTRRLRLCAIAFMIVPGGTPLGAPPGTVVALLLGKLLPVGKLVRMLGAPGLCGVLPELGCIRRRARSREDHLAGREVRVAIDLRRDPVLAPDLRTGGLGL